MAEGTARRDRVPRARCLLPPSPRPGDLLALHHPLPPSLSPGDQAEPGESPTRSHPQAEAVMSEQQVPGVRMSWAIGVPGRPQGVCLSPTGAFLVHACSSLLPSASRLAFK